LVVSLDEVLDECIDLLVARGATLEECVARWPEHACELTGLLVTALDFREARASVPGADAPAPLWRSAPCSDHVPTELFPGAVL
jgi:hypothetical protein